MKRAASFLLATALCAVAGGCHCLQTGYAEVKSPDGRYVAIERETNCGATDPFGTEVTIRAQEPRFGLAWFGHASKRIFLADVRLGDVHVKWTDGRNLEVACTGCEKYGVAKEVSAWRDVEVKFDVGTARKGVF